MKKLAELLLVLSCLLCVAACSDKETEVSSDTSAPTEASTEKITEPTTAAETAAVTTTTTTTAATSAATTAEIPEPTTRDIQYEVYLDETHHCRPEWHELTYIDMNDIVPPETASYMVECTQTSYSTDNGYRYIKYYDEHDNPLTSYYFNSDEAMDANMMLKGDDIYSYEYNPDGTIAVRYDNVIIPGYERTNKAVYEYDDLGRTTVIRHYNQDGIEYLIHEYTYEGDNPDYSLYEQKYYQGGSLKTGYTSKWKPTYNYNGQLISKTDSNSYTTTYQYDDKGNLVCEKSTNFQSLYEYDEQNRLVKTEIFHDGEWNTTKEYEYTLLN